MYYQNSLSLCSWVLQRKSKSDSAVWFVFFHINWHGMAVICDCLRGRLSLWTNGPQTVEKYTHSCSNSTHKNTKEKNGIDDTWVWVWECSTHTWKTITWSGCCLCYMWNDSGRIMMSLYCSNTVMCVELFFLLCGEKWPSTMKNCLEKVPFKSSSVLR